VKEIKFRAWIKTEKECAGYAKVAGRPIVKNTNYQGV
jgi:hypothetical protein